MKVTFITEKNLDSTLGEPFKYKLKHLLDSKSLALTSYELDEKAMHHCIGCFNCWLKTPGTCIHKDIGRDITVSIINSDLVIWLTPIVYGGYSPLLKKAVDRQLPLVLPFFTLINGEMHHSKRYKKYTDVLSIGYSEDVLSTEIEIFKDLSIANKNNFYAENLYTYTFKNPFEGDTVLTAIDKILKKYEGRLSS